MNILRTEKKTAVLQHITEGCSIRSTERLTGVHRDTVGRVSLEAAAASRTVHDRFMQWVKPERVEIDEIWSYVGRKQKNGPTGDEGDVYTFTAIDPASKVIIAYHTGKRDEQNTQIFLEDLKSRLGIIPIINSDGYIPYRENIENIFGAQQPYGQVVKQYAQGGRRIASVTKRVVSGNVGEITTACIERSNLTLRMTQRRFTRRTNAFSKKLSNHKSAIDLFVGHYNFCRVHESLRVTPAMALGITNHVWSFEELLSQPEPMRGKRYGKFMVIEGGAI